MYRFYFSLLCLLGITTANAQHTIRVAPSDDIHVALRQAEQWADDSLWTTIEVEPGVYWIDDPDDLTIKKPSRPGAPPYGMEVRLSRTRIVGVSDNPEDVVLASQRGQTQGADGNFTMFHFVGDSVVFENLTMGNYCNVDLVYPRNPELNRKRKADAIVQAQLAICNGDGYVARNCRFISRLNLCPLAGAKHALFQKCYFECTDDALCGSGVYVGCKFTFYSSKPFYSTSRQGAVFMDCDIHTKVHGLQYLTKVPGTVFMIDCRWTSEDPNLQLAWTSVPGRKLRCYQHNVTLNGVPYFVGGEGCENTVDMTGKPMLDRFKRNDTYYYTEGLPEALILADAERLDSADIEYAKDVYETVREDDGREAVIHTRITPLMLPAPEVVSPLKVKRSGRRYTANYELALNGHDDTSDLVWYRDYGTHRHYVQVGGRKYTDQKNDGEKYRIMCELVPKTNRSYLGEPVQLCDYRQDDCCPGAWSMTTYKPKDIAPFPWKIDDKASGWRWSKGFDGAAESLGLFTTSRGCRLMFASPYNDKVQPMTACIEIDPCKTAGQGFGSATGQYMDIAVAYDNKTKSGYALRLERTPYLDKAVEVKWVKHSDGQITIVSEPVQTTTFKPGCVVTISFDGTDFAAELKNDNANAVASTNCHAADGKLGTGFMLQHTGSLGSGGLVIRSLNLDYTGKRAYHSDINGLSRCAD